MIIRQIKHAALGMAAIALAGCATVPAAPDSPVAVCPAPLPCPSCPACPGTATPVPGTVPLQPVRFEDIPEWHADDASAAWPAFRASCNALRLRSEWREVCTAAAAIAAPDPAATRRFFERHFVPHRAAAADGGVTGLITGYYEPLLRGSRVRSGRYATPLYGPPGDLLTIDLAAINPELRSMRLRGRLEGRRIVPYYSRAEIEQGVAPVSGREIVWVEDPVEAFFLQIQGSGRIELESGERIRIGYADQNGHPYSAIGRWLVERGEIKPGEASMQAIKAWAQANPSRLTELLNQNASYVFFREIKPNDGLPPDAGPLGAMGIPLTPGRSIAVDPRFIPLGAPVFLVTTMPASATPLARLMLAQDTGGAIRGVVRADFFWGFGAEAGALAGRMRQQGEMWVLLPQGMTPK